MHSATSGASPRISRTSGHYSTATPANCLAHFEHSTGFDAASRCRIRYASSTFLCLRAPRCGIVEFSKEVLTGIPIEIQIKPLLEVFARNQEPW
jgi:hypothetical protein